MLLASLSPSYRVHTADLLASYSAITPPRYVNPTPPSPGGRGSSRQGRGMGGQNGPQADTDVQRHPRHSATV
jgi:hypothetical protein